MMFRCSSCKQEKPREEFHEFASDCHSKEVTSQCKSCRSDGYHRDRYGTKCVNCGRWGKISKINAFCKKCNAECGLRECRDCGELLPESLCYYDGKSVCKTCTKQRRTNLGRDKELPDGQ